MRLVLGILLLAAACARPARRTTPAATVAPGPSGTLVELQPGDAACYVILSSDAGPAFHPGDFELCAGGARDATGLVGQRVVTTTRQEKILAAACEGDVGCGQSDVVDLVVSVTSAESDRLGPLGLGDDAAAVIQLLGEPGRKGEVVEQGADGMFVSDWTWPDRGVVLQMHASAPDGRFSVASVTLTAPCAYRTRGVGIGSSRAEVERAYRGEVGEDSRDDLIVIGSMYGGTLFSLADGKVSQIFLGAAAE